MKIRFESALQHHILLILTITAVLIAVFFNGVPPESFIFIHDEYLIFPGHEVRNQFYVHSFTDFGTATLIQLIVTLLDRIYYTLAYFSGLNLYTTQLFLYLLKLLIILLIPYLGFAKLGKLYDCGENKNLSFAISLWYSFNTYTLIYWHSNAFSLTLLICYTLAPLTLYCWEMAILSPPDIKARLMDKLSALFSLALLLFSMSFAIYLFAPFIMLLAIYTALRVLMEKNKRIAILRYLFWLGVISTPLFAVYLSVGYEMFFVAVDAHSTKGSETNGNIQGGLLYMSLMWFTWPIYVHWSPRNVYTFSTYFTTPLSVIAPFLLYAIITMGAIFSRSNIRFFIFLVLWLIFWLLAKGPQQPLGDLYLFMLEHVPGFRVFRSPDAKFGFSIVLSISVLLIFAGAANKSKYSNYVAVLILAVAAIQSWPILTGIAIQGENKNDSYDRVIHIPNEYIQLADYLNNGERAWGYVITSPSVEFGNYLLGQNDEHLGQDLLPKMIRHPFVYGSESSGMPMKTFAKLKRSLEVENFDELKQLAIRYYIFRSDVKTSEANSLLRNFTEGHFVLTFKNRFFTVYEDKTASPLVEGEDISYHMTSPVKINVKPLTHRFINKLILHQNLNSGWRLYADTNMEQHGQARSIIVEWLENITYLWRQPVSIVKSTGAYGYANGWHISEQENTLLSAAQPSSPLSSKKPATFTIFYWPQAFFSLLVIISFFSAIVYLFTICIIASRYKMLRPIEKKIRDA